MCWRKVSAGGCVGRWGVGGRGWLGRVHVQKMCRSDPTHSCISVSSLQCSISTHASHLTPSAPRPYPPPTPPSPFLAAGLAGVPARPGALAGRPAAAGVRRPGGGSHGAELCAGVCAVGRVWVAWCTGRRSVPVPSSHRRLPLLPFIPLHPPHPHPRSHSRSAYASWSSRWTMRRPTSPTCGAAPRARWGGGRGVGGGVQCGVVRCVRCSALCYVCCGSWFRVAVLRAARHPGLN